ncbi:M1 family aminopeptidase [Shewanella fodinae]|uniref:Peptidase M1-like protein n=1 Tax=Shewanella fodinae TaxID=552357 RepID=A0A4V2RT32_9GAMM|nr:M1 family aminopeptidase [Shewanella fodinae]TCN90334.1 peptidase M1-like protein [Shewanella fodinae]
MLLALLRFEWRYYLRQPSFYVVALLLFFVSFFAVVSENIRIGGGGEVLKNSPFAISQTLLIMGIIGMFAVVNFVGSTAVRNQQYQMEEILYSKPLRPLAYHLGRFIGSYLVVLAVFAFVPLAMWLGSYMPWVDASRFGPNHLQYYLVPFLTLSMPTLLLLSALFYAMASRFRSLMGLYLTAVILFVLYNLSGEMASQPQYRNIAAILDPFGLRAFSDVARYWTMSEKNTLVAGLHGVLLLNRVLWLVVALALLLLSGIWRYPQLAQKKERKSKKVDTVPTLQPLAQLLRPTAPSALLQFNTRVKFEIRQVLLSASFMVLGAITIFTLGSQLLGDYGWYGTSDWPVTQIMVDNITGATSMLMVLVLIYYSAEIVWRERSSGMGDIIDALPVPNLVFWGSKLLSTLLVMVLLYVLATATTIVFQLLKGQYTLELAQYAIRLGYFNLLPLFLSVILAFFLQVVSPNKYAGMGLFIAYFMTTLVMANWGLGHSLYNFALSPFMRYSDMNGYGWSLKTHTLYMIYWGAFSLILFVVGYGLYHRGPQQSLRYRLVMLGRQLGTTGKLTIATAAVLFVLTGSYLFYQTKVVNDYITSETQMDLQADYEKHYKQYESMPMLTTTAVNAAIDIFPEQRTIKADVSVHWQNRSGAEISRILINLPSHTKATDLQIDIPGATLGQFDDKYRVAWLTFTKPVAPASAINGHIRLLRKTVGIEEADFDYEVVHNGTFINNWSLLPRFGYNAGYELDDRHEREKRGLQDRPRAHKLEDSRFYTQNFFGVDGGFIDFQATVSTSADQVAIVPGYLQKEWQEDGRRYFHYQMDNPMVNFYSILSGHYALKKQDYKGIAIEVYYHPAHGWNVDRMMEAVRDAIDYYSQAFGPYQHRQLRIIEFPGYRSFAQSFANTVPYSEKIGFVTDLRDKEKIDPVYYVTAHEVAHQWWGHQLGAADVQGSAVLSESLSQYSALMVLQHKYGAEILRKFLKYELDRYLRGRSAEQKEELPLLRTEGQDYIHYQKGSVIMMALEDHLGEQRLNDNLKAFLERYRYRNDPYPTTLDLLTYLKRDTTAEQSQFIDESFRDITLYDLRLTKATVAPLDNGKFKVSMDIFAQRKVADGQGKETEKPLNEAIDIGAFSANPDKLQTPQQVLLLQKYPLHSGDNHLEIVLDSKPAYVGVDPYVKLVDRDAADNIYKL